MCSSDLIFMSGCSKDDININIKNDITDSGGNSGNNSNNNSGSSKDSTSTGTSESNIYLSANLLSMITKAGTTPIQANRYVDVYVYTSGNFLSTYHYVSGNGVLDPESGTSQITLPTGTYYFYFPGINTAGIRVPTDDTSDLSNGVDYIWSEKRVIVTSGTDQQVDVTFSHCCTQVMIKLLIDSVTLDLSTTPTMYLQPP